MKAIEAKADSLLRDIGITHPPISIERVAAYLGIRIAYEPFDDGLSGVLIRKHDSAVIGVNQTHSLVRKRFSIAHEIGHYCLRHIGDIFVDKVVLNKRDGRSSYGIDRPEIEANAFAAALLMPARMVEKAVLTLVEEDPSISLAMLHAELARRFHVSQQAIGYRLVNLGLAAPDDES
jgi:Zn-dependent peptidase ImmA (M78 family)